MPGTSIRIWDDRARRHSRLGGVGVDASRPASDADADIHAEGSDDSRARRGASADGDPDAEQSKRAAADFVPTHSVWGTERSSASHADQLEGAGSGRLHL